MIDLLINNISYLDKLKTQSLGIDKELTDNSCKFSLLLSIDDLSKVDITSEVVVKDGSNVVFGGLISELDFDRYKDLVKLSVSCVSYNTVPMRKIITLPAVTTVGDIDACEGLVRAILADHLSTYGITEGHIQSNIKIDDSEDIDDGAEGNIRDKLDAISQASSCQWYIDVNKKLYFFPGVQNFTEHITPITWTDPDFRGISLKKELTDYRNKQILVGGEPTETVADEYLDDNGNLRIVRDSIDEQNRIKALTGADGVWENTTTNANLTTLAGMNKSADELFGKYGKPVTNLEFKTFKGQYNPGDYIYIDIPQFLLNNAKFVIESISIEDKGNQLLEYSIKANMRSSNTAKDNFYDYLKSLSNKKADQSAGKSNFAEQINVQIQDAIQTGASIQFI